MYPENNKHSGYFNEPFIRKSKIIETTEATPFVTKRCVAGTLFACAAGALLGLFAAPKLLGIDTNKVAHVAAAGLVGAIGSGVLFALARGACRRTCWKEKRDLYDPDADSGTRVSLPNLMVHVSEEQLDPERSDRLSDFGLDLESGDRRSAGL